MSKICGIISPNLNEKSIRKILHKMTKSMQHENWHRIDEWCENAIGLGHISIGAINKEIQPILSYNNKKIIISAGKIVAYKDRKRELIEKNYKFHYSDNDAEFVLCLYEEYGITKFRELNGIFAFSIWDKTKNELILVNDRYGMRQLYYYFDENRKLLIFASEIKAISRQDFFDKKVDWNAWNIFMRLGFFIGEDTFFRNIRVLPQGSILHFDLKKIIIKNYWNFNSLRKKIKFDEKKDIDNLIFLFKQSMRRRIVPGKKAVVFLSGGLDSRGLAAELKHQNIEFTSYTTRKFSAHDIDEQLASTVANRLGIKNEFCDLPNDFLETKTNYENYLLDYQSGEHAWLLPLLDTLPLDVKINYDGLGQDIMCDSDLYAFDNRKYLDLLETGKYEQFINDWLYLKKFAFFGWPIQKNRNRSAFFSKKIRNYFSDEVFFTKIKQEFMKYESSDNKYLLFHLANRARREISLVPFQLIINKAESFCPYLDNDYFEYLMSLPITAKYNQTLRSKILNRAYPELFEINAVFCNKTTDKYMKYHPEIYSQKIRYLLKMEVKFLKYAKKDIYNFIYLLPRIFYDFGLIAHSFLRHGKKLEKICACSHFGLISQLLFLNNWLLTEGITKEDLLIK